MTVNADGSYTFEPGEGFQDLGVDETRDVTFTYSVDDGNGGTAEEIVTVTVTGSNDGPVAEAGTLDAVEDGGAVNGQLSAADVDGDDLSYALTTDSADGTVTVNADGSFSFEPNENFSGETSFTYTVTDPSGATSTETVTVNVDGVVDAAEITTTDATGNEDSAIALDIDVSSVDDISSITLTDIPDGAVLADANGNEITVTDGSASISQDQLEGLTITPPENSNADFSISVSVTTEQDGETTTVTSSVDVDVVGVADAPTLTVTLGEGQITYVGGGGGEGGIDASDANFTSGDDTVTVNGLNQNQNISTAAGDDTLIINGDTGGGNNINLGSGDDNVVFNGDIGGNTAVHGASGNDAVYFGKGPDSYQVQNLTDNNGKISAQVVDLDTGQTVTMNNVEAIVFGDGSVIGDENLVDPDLVNQASAQVTYDLNIDSSLTDTDGSESLSITVDGLPDGAVLSAGTQNADGSWTLDSGDLPGLKITVSGDDAGDAFNLNVSATATENDGSTATVSQSVSSTGTETDLTAEGATIDATDATGTEDTAIALDIDIMQLDTDGSETMTITLSDIPDGAVLRDGDGNEITITGGAADVTPQQLDGLTITPPENSNDDFSLTVTTVTTEESSGETSTSTATLDIGVTGVADDLEVTANDVSGGEDTAVVLDLSAALGDNDGSETLSVTISDIPDGAVLTDANGNEISVTNGAADVDPSQLAGLTITPPENFNGAMDLTLTSTATENDGDISTNVSTFTVDVAAVNDGPVAENDTGAATEDGGAVEIDVLANDSDVDGDSLTVTSATLPEGAEGAVTINEDGTISFDPGEGYQTLAEGETQDVEITYTIDDGQGGTSEATVTVTVTGSNDGPVAQAGAIDAVEDGGAVSGQLSASDVDGDDLTYALVDGPAEGSVTVNADGSYSFEPGEGFQDLGVDETRDVTFTYSVDDGNGGTAQETVTVTITGSNDGPVAEAQSIDATEDGGPVTGQLTATDVDGDDLSYALTEGSSDGTVTVNADGSFSFEPNENFAGETSFTYTVSDGNGGMSTETVTVNVDGVVDAAEITTTDATGNEDSAIALDIDVSSVDDISSITLTDIPDGAVLMDANGNEITVTDGSASISQDQLEGLTITPPADSNEDFAVGVSVTTEQNGETVTVESSVDVDVVGVADAPTLTVTLGEGEVEGGTTDVGASQATLDAAGTDGASVTVSGVPEGASLSAGTDNGDGSWTLDGGDLQGLTITPPDGSNATDVALSIEVTGEGGGETLITENFDDGVTGWEGHMDPRDGKMEIDHNDSATKTFDFGSENAGKTVTISFESEAYGGWDESGTYQDNFTVSANGQEMVDTSEGDATNHSFTVTLDENGQVQIEMEVDATADDEGVYVDNFQIVSGEDWDATLATETVDVDLEPQMVSFDLDIDSASTDSDDSETISVTIDDLPPGTLLFAGDTQITIDGGSATLSADQLQNLTVKVPVGNEDFALDVTATATENDGDSATTSSTISVTMPEIDNSADGATITENDASGFEDTAIALDIDVDMNDNDGSETLSITISDIPSGAVLHDGDGNEISITGGSAELTAGQLEGLTITPPENSNVDFDLTVTATTTETSTGETASSEVTLSVDVTGVADAPELSVDLGDPSASGGAPSPVAYWNMDETNGTTLHDQVGNNDGHSYEVGSGSGSGHGSGSGSGGAQLKSLDLDDETNLVGSGSGAGQHDEVTADLNTAAEFKDSDRQFIEVDHSAALKPPSGTMTMWFNTDDAKNGTLASSDSSGYDSGGHFNLSINSSGKLELRMQDENSSNTISGGDVDKGEWNQVTVSWGEGGMKIYQNGELVASDPSYTGGLQGNENPWTFGASQASSGNNTSEGVNDFFDGHIDDIAIYDTPMTDQQAQDLYEMGVEDFADSGGDEVLTYPVEIGGGLVDTDGSESLSYSISDLPDGAQLLVNGEVMIADENGAYSLSDDDIGNVEISVPGDTGDFAFSVSATATEDDGSSRTVTTIGGIDDSSSDTSFEQLSDGGDTWDNDANSTSVEAISGGDGNDTVWTGGGDDTIAGGGGDDRLYGEDGDDTLYGGDGDDTLIGGDGDDVLVGGAGDDVALGGQGDDLFIFGAGDGADHFDGGNGWSDTIQLDGVDGGPGGEGGWTLQLDDGRSFTAGEDGIDFGDEVAGKIELADGSELTFEGVEKLEW